MTLRSNRLCAILLIFTTLFSAFGIAQAAKKDVKGSKDHPMVSRYPGSIIKVYKFADYDEYQLPLAKPEMLKGKPTFTKLKTIEGKITRIAYQIEKGTSTLKVFRNFSNAFRQAGFKTLFECKKQDCGHSSGWQRFFLQSQVWGRNESQRAFVGQFNKGKKTLFVVFYVGDQGNRIMAEIDIIESKTMKSDLIKVDPEKLGSDIDTTGKAVVYGIYFDTDKATLKPGSKPALDAIAKLLKLKPALKLYVVGHTDDQGELQHNVKLSNARASAVVSTLVKQYRVDASRLLAHGAGPYSPVAPNINDQGKAKNRRVELVRRLK